MVDMNEEQLTKYLNKALKASGQLSLSNVVLLSEQSDLNLVYNTLFEVMKDIITEGGEKKILSESPITSGNNTTNECYFKGLVRGMGIDGSYSIQDLSYLVRWSIKNPFITTEVWFKDLRHGLGEDN